MSRLTSSQLCVASATTIKNAIEIIREGKAELATTILEGHLEQLNDYLSRQDFRKAQYGG